MYVYTDGAGHYDLAKRFGTVAEDISITGSANSRILRTTLKHSYQSERKCLYVRTNLCK
jgi:hypothetical protein